VAIDLINLSSRIDAAPAVAHTEYKIQTIKRHMRIPSSARNLLDTTTASSIGKINALLNVSASWSVGRLSSTTSAPRAVTFTPELLDEIFNLVRGHERHMLATTVDHAYEMIWKQLMLTGGRSGERLSDVALAAQLGVSRTPVRQALYRLTEDGLVVSDPRRGFWMRTFTAHDVHEIYVLRSALEVLALRLAAPRLDPADLERHLREVRDLIAHRDANSVANHLRSDLHLHNLLILNSGNSRLIRALASLRSQHSMFQVHDVSYPQRVELAAHDHEVVLTALIDGDAERASSLMADHIKRSGEAVLADLFPGEDAHAGGELEHLHRRR
jgi:DNA-binding GntR family transcriptional regulator